MAPKPHFTKVAEQFVEERDEYDDDDEHYEPANLGGPPKGGLGGLGGIGGPSKGGLGGIGGLGGRGGRGLGGLSGTSGLGGLGGFGGRGGIGGGLGNPGGRGGRSSLGGLQISGDKGRGGFSGFGVGKAVDSKTGGDSSVHALEEISKAQKEVVKAVGQQVDAMQDISKFLHDMSNRTLEMFNVVASKIASQEPQESVETLGQLAKHIDDQMTGDDVYLIIPGSEYQVVDSDALQELVKDKKIHVCSGIQSVAASINKDE